MRDYGILRLGQILVLFLLIIFASSMAYGETLQEEFDQLCIHTPEASSLPMEKLRELLADCDKLQKRIEGSSDGKKKLLLFRLNKCRNFYAYMIELKEGGKSVQQQ